MACRTTSRKYLRHEMDYDAGLDRVYCKKCGTLKNRRLMSDAEIGFGIINTALLTANLLMMSDFAMTDSKPQIYKSLVAEYP